MSLALAYVWSAASQVRNIATPLHMQGAGEVELIALVLLPVALLLCGYSLLVYNWRTSAIRNKTELYYDDRRYVFLKCCSAPCSCIE